jgi:predicted nucleic acid-binding protein
VAVALVDSSAIVAYIVAGDTLHDPAADAIETVLAAGTPLAMSAVTWSEVLQGALLGYYEERDIRELAQDFGIRVLPVDVAVAEKAAALQAAYRATSTREPRPKLRTPDALILATAAIYDDIELVIGGDEQWTKVPGVGTEIVLLVERPS